MSGKAFENEYISRDGIIAEYDRQHKGPLGEARKIMETFPAADVVSASDFRDCRNELCLKCGAYTQKHNGACDGCRWRQT